MVLAKKSFVAIVRINPNLSAFNDQARFSDKSIMDCADSADCNGRKPDATLKDELLRGESRSSRTGLDFK
jgi:hypothetical protein